MNRSILPIILLVSLFMACEDKVKPDKTPPELTIVSPTAGETFRDTVSIQVDTKDDKGIAYLKFFINDSLHYTDSTLNYEYEWDTKKAPNGEYTIKVISVDEAFNKIEKSVTISLLNLPGDYYPQKIEKFASREIDFEKPFIYLALDQQGLWRKNYTIESSQWEYMGFSDTSGMVGAVDVSVNGDNIIVSSWSEHFWHSADGGATWENTYLDYGDKNNEDLYTLWLERSPHDPNIIIAQESGAGIFLSHDSGYTWDFVYGTIGIGDTYDIIKWHSHKSGEVWIYGVEDMRMRGNMVGLKENGNSLKHKTDFKTDFQPSINYIIDLEFSGSDNDVIYSLTEWSEIYKSMDGGLSWNRIKDNTNRDENYSFLLEDHRYPNNYFLFYEKNIYYSKDEFQTIQLIKAVSDYIIIPNIYEGHIFYLTNNGLKMILIENLNTN